MEAKTKSGSGSQCLRHIGCLAFKKRCKGEVGLSSRQTTGSRSTPSVGDLSRRLLGPAGLQVGLELPYSAPIELLKLETSCSCLDGFRVRRRIQDWHKGFERTKSRPDRAMDRADARGAELRLIRGKHEGKRTEVA